MTAGGIGPGGADGGASFEASLGISGISNLSEIGRGGFGVVYRAWQPDFRRWVAVKLITTPPNELAAARFERERWTIGALTGHPNIVTVFSSGETSHGLPYIVMEFLPGGSLADRLPAHPFESAEAVRLMGRIALAVQSAHDAGVLHRDIKPENILLSAHGEPKLGDFGIARLEGVTETTSGVVTASIAHAAPELLDGQKPTPRSDVYALGSTLFMLIAGTPAFIRADDPSVMPVFARIARDPVPDLTGRGVPDRVQLALERAMAKDAADRYDSASAFAMALGVDASDPSAAPFAPVPAPPAPTADESADLPGSVTAPTVALESSVGDTPAGAPTVDSPVEPTLVLPAAQAAQATVPLASPTERIAPTSSVAGGGGGRSDVGSAGPGVTFRSSRPWWLLISALVLVLVLVGVFVLTRADRSSPPSASASTGSSPGASEPVVAGIRGPSDVAVAADGTLFVANRSDGRLLRIGADRKVATMASGLADAASVAVGPTGTAFVSVVSDSTVRSVTADGLVTTVAGFGGRGWNGDNHPPLETKLSLPRGIAVDGSGLLVIADTDNNRVRRLAPGPDGLLLTIAGVPAAPGPVSPPGGFGGDGGPATGAALNQPSAVANGPDGSLLIVDRDNHRVRQVLGGIITTIAGPDLRLSTGQTVRNQTTFGVVDAATGPDGTMYATDGSHVYRIRPRGELEPIDEIQAADAPSGSRPEEITGIAVDPSGAIVASDGRGNRIYRISPGGSWDVVAV